MPRVAEIARGTRRAVALRGAFDDASRDGGTVIHARLVKLCKAHGASARAYT